MNDAVKIVEVGPRDGLQNEKSLISTADKLRYIDLLVQANLKVIEVSSFVRPESIAQMADASSLYRQVNDLYGNSGVHFPCLVPNQHGFDQAMEVGVKEIALFSATSNTFNQKNINTDIAGSFERFKPLFRQARAQGVRVRAYLSTVFGCPYEGESSPALALELTQRFLDLGAYEVSLGDTIGVATPLQVENLLAIMAKKIPLSALACHFHDTRAMALANILTAYRCGIRIFDASSGGLGGCPYAQGATGNVATEEVLYLLESLHAKTQVDFSRLCQASKFILSKLGRESASKLLRAYQAKGEQL